jgi:hypothetical protein
LRGIYTEEELAYLVGWMEEENELRLAAAKALASFLHKSPYIEEYHPFSLHKKNTSIHVLFVLCDLRSEFALARETICRAITKSKQGLQYLLSLAISGVVRIVFCFEFETEYLLTFLFEIKTLKLSTSQSH